MKRLFLADTAVRLYRKAFYGECGVAKTLFKMYTDEVFKKLYPTVSKPWASSGSVDGYLAVLVLVYFLPFPLAFETHNLLRLLALSMSGRMASRERHP